MIKSKIRKKRILLVDGEADFLLKIKNRLSLMRYDCEEASNGHEALQKIKTYSPDLVLLDLNLPSMSGYGFLREYENISSSKKKAPVVIFSALNDQEVVQGAYDLGANAYLSKSSSRSEFIDLIEKFV